MNKAYRLHKYALWGLAIMLLIGLFLPSAQTGEVEPTAKWWLFSIGLYIPFYVTYAQQKGEITLLPGTVLKNDNPTVFRLAQTMYLIMSVFIVITLVYRNT